MRLRGRDSSGASPLKLTRRSRGPCFQCAVASGYSRDLVLCPPYHGSSNGRALEQATVERDDHVVVPDLDELEEQGEAGTASATEREQYAQPMYALTDAQAAELKRREREIVDAFLAGELTDVAEAKAARDRATEELGTPVPEKLVLRAIRKHGDRGLGALDVAAAWTLARGSTRRPPPLRRPRSEARPRGRRATRRTRARSPARLDDPEPEPPLRVISLPAFRRELRRALGGRA